MRIRQISHFVLLFSLLGIPLLVAADAKPSIVDLVQLQHPGYYRNLIEAQKHGGPDAAAVVIDVPNGYVSDAFTTGAGHVGQTYVVYYPEGRGAILAHANWNSDGTPIEFFEHSGGIMNKIPSLLPELDCAMLSTAKARENAYKMIPQKDWLKKFRVIYQLPRNGTKISAFCSFTEEATVLMDILAAAKIESGTFDAALQNGKPLSGLFSIQAEFRWDKKAGKFTRIK